MKHQCKHCLDTGKVKQFQFGSPVEFECDCQKGEQPMRDIEDQQKIDESTDDITVCPECGSEDCRECDCCGGPACCCKNVQAPENLSPAVHHVGALAVFNDQQQVADAIHKLTTAVENLETTISRVITTHDTVAISKVPR